MNAKKGRPASLTPSLLARKGEAEPSRLADGSTPRDVMALHEEIVARLADEIAQEGAASGAPVLHEDDDDAGREPRFAFDDAATGDDTEDAGEFVNVAAQHPPYEDDTDFEYDESAPETPAVAAPQISAPVLASVRPADFRADAETFDADDLDPGDREIDEVVEAHEPRSDLRPAPLEAAITRGAPQAPFVTLRPAAPQAPQAAGVLPQAKVIASLPAVFAVIVAIAIGGGVGLWFANSMAPKPPAAAETVVASDVTPVATPAEPAVTPLDVPPPAEVSVAPIDTPAAPALRKSAPISASTPVPVPSPVAKAPAPVKAAPVAATKAAAAPSAGAALTGAYGIQLLATPVEGDAAKAWERIAARHSTALGGVPHEIVRADLGAKGVYYRLRAGSYASRAEAKALCATLAAAKQDCIVIKR